MNESRPPLSAADRPNLAPVRGCPPLGRPWLWVVFALGLFVAGNIVAIAICVTHPQVMLR